MSVEDGPQSYDLGNYNRFYILSINNIYYTFSYFNHLSFLTIMIIVNI